MAIGVEQGRLLSKFVSESVRVAAAGGLQPGTHGAVGGIVLEARTYELIRSSPDRALTDTMVPLELPPIKGKTRSVTAYRLSPPPSLP